MLLLIPKSCSFTPCMLFGPNNGLESRRRHLKVTLKYIVCRSWETILPFTRFGFSIKIVIFDFFHFACWHITGVLSAISYFHDWYWVGKTLDISPSVRMRWVVFWGRCGGNTTKDCYFGPWLFTFFQGVFPAMVQFFFVVVVVFDTQKKTWLFEWIPSICNNILMRLSCTWHDNF